MPRVQPDRCPVCDLPFEGDLESCPKCHRCRNQAPSDLPVLVRMLVADAKLGMLPPDERMAKFLGKDAASKPPADGPEPPNRVRWQGQLHSLPPRLWQILNALWNKESVQQETLVSEVWRSEGETPVDSTVRTALHKLNARLATIGIPWQYSLQSGYIIKS